MRLILSACLAALISASAANALTLKSTEAAAVSPWGVFSLTPAGSTGAIQVEIAKIKTAGGPRPEAYWTSDPPEEFWVAEKAGSKGDATQWADSRSCSALSSVVAKLEGAASTRHEPSSISALTAGDLDALAPCWSDRPPI